MTRVVEQYGWWYVVDDGMFHGFPFPSRSTALETLAAARVSNEFPMSEVF